MGKNSVSLGPPKEIEHSSEIKVIFIFLDFLCSRFFSIFTLHSLTFFSFFSPIIIVHILTISFAFTNLLAKLSFSRKLHS
jgi:hypothetical protein